MTWSVKEPMNLFLNTYIQCTVLYFIIKELLCLSQRGGRQHF